MFLSNGKRLTMGLAAGLFAVPALAADGTGPDVAGEIQALRARIDQLEAEQKARQTAQKEAQQQASLDSVLKDADRHSQFMDSVGFTGGWNKSKSQFFLGSEDGNFYLHPIIIFQFRGVVNDRERAKKNNTDDTQVGFEVRRAKFGFDGNLFTPDLTYKFQWQNSQTGAPTLEYAWAQYVFAKNVFHTGDVAIRAGQYKDIVFKEENISDASQVMSERSLANTLVGGNQPNSNLTQGVDFLWLGKNNPLHAELLLGDGYGSALTAFGQPHGTPVVLPQTPTNPPVNPAYAGAAARVDWKVFGDWADTTDFTGINSGKKDLLDVGGGVDFTSAQAAQEIRYTVDVQYQLAHRISLFAAGYGDYFDYQHLKKGSPNFVNNFGGVVEGGYLLTPAVQLTGRYSISAMDNRYKIAGQGTFQEIAAGFNWFGPHGAWGNHARFTTEVAYLPDGSPAAGGLEYLASPTTRFRAKQEFALRTQFQIWF